MKGRDLFDATLFRDAESTSVFYTFISELKRSIDAASPSPTHEFIKTLDSKKKLLRSYTQNIDGLEERAGLVGSSAPEARAVPSKGSTAAGKLHMKDVRNVQLHGDIHRVRCTLCSVDLMCTEEHLRLFGLGQAPDCPECAFRAQERAARPRQQRNFTKVRLRCLTCTLLDAEGAAPLPYSFVFADLSK